jgi:hypothetical protein
MRATSSNDVPPELLPHPLSVLDDDVAMQERIERILVVLKPATPAS